MAFRLARPVSKAVPIIVSIFTKTPINFPLFIARIDNDGNRLK